MPIVAALCEAEAGELQVQAHSEHPGDLIRSYIKIKNKKGVGMELSAKALTLISSVVPFPEKKNYYDACFEILLLS